MSQKKVDRYKKEKANRKRIMKKEKTLGVLRGTAAAIVLCALLGWAGISMYRSYEDKQPRSVVEIDYDAVNSYISELGE